MSGPEAAPEGDARLRQLRALLLDDPEDPFTRYALAIQLKGLGRREEAALELETVVREHPDYLPSYYHWGALLVALGQGERAAEVLRRGLEVAQRAGDQHARSELEDLLGEL